MVTGSNPGLDRDALLGMLSTAKSKEANAQSMIQRHLEEHPDSFLSFSGGKDSTVLVVLATRIKPDIPVCFYDSGMEFPETLEYVSTIVDTFDLNFHHIHAGDVLGVLVEHAWYNHYRDARDVGVSLKDVKITMPSDLAHSKFGKGRLWGLRSDESNGRAALLRSTRGITRYRNGQVACAPLWNWTDSDVRGYLARNRIPLNPLYDKLTRLGVPAKEQRAGAYFDGGLDFGRMTWLKRGWPEIYDQLKEALPRLEEYR